MHLNYYEAEWLTKYKLRESLNQSRKDNQAIRSARRRRSKRIGARPIAPVLRNSDCRC